MSLALAARLRRLWLDVHLWTGVALMAVLIPLGVSGSILVWHDPLDHALHAERFAVSGPGAGLPVAAYAGAAQAAFGPRAALTQLRLPQKPGDPVVAVGRMPGAPGPGGRPRSLNAWIDPPTGRVLATAEAAKGFTMVTHRLHGSLLVPGVGRKLVGWLGWAMFVSCATGLWLWWPRRGGFPKGLRWRRGASQLFNLHHTVGFWLCLPLAVLSLSGVYIAFPQTARVLFGVAEAPRADPPRPGGRGDPRFAPPLAAPRLTVEQAVAAALAEHPGARVTALNLPLEGRRPAWRVELGKAPAVKVDDASGRASVARDAGGGADPLSRLVRRIHDGTDLGLAWQTVIFTTGLAPAVLGLTGLVMWLRRRARRRALAAA